MFMNTRWEIRVGVILIVILVSIALQGCGQAPIVDRVLDPQPQERVAEDNKDNGEGIPNFKGIAEALGCVFAPDTCNK
jgi:hypothetical protein